MVGVGDIVPGVASRRDKCGTKSVALRSCDELVCRQPLSRTQYVVYKNYTAAL
jgi:hypothetical protein